MIPTLRQIIAEAKANRVAIGHFNFSDSLCARAIVDAARELGVPILLGTSEGERDFFGVREAAAFVKNLREVYQIPIYLNADHTHSLDKVKTAVDAGYDAILFDGGKLPLHENIARTKEVVAYVKSVNPEIVVEGELGYIGSSSEVRDALPEGAAIRPEDLTKPEDAARFVEETGVDLLAPAVGNIHGMFSNATDPALDIPRVKAIADVAGVPLVLHGASGNSDADVSAAIRAGVSIVHINTEIRLAWKRGVEEGLTAMPNEVAPYKILTPAYAGVKEVVLRHLKVFSGSV